MNAKKSWDSSLVKKFSSSNHFKLLNQLKNEVIKYPLNKKKVVTSNSSKDNRFDTKSISNSTKSIIKSIDKDLAIKNDTFNNQSTISFNNSKNFSIYKNINDGPSPQEKENNSSIENNSVDDSSSMSFKDRLNQIDMK